MQTVRHCYDFGTVLSTMPDDLSAAQKREMTVFFARELQTLAWMRALSTHDPDVTFSVRPDHQWTGAYAAWPAIALTALYHAGEDRRAYEWMRGLARTARQGPIGQAHFAETAVDPEAGGGRESSVGFAVDYGLGMRVGKRVFGADFRRAVRNSRSVVWEAEHFAALWRVRSGGGVAGVELSGETISGVGAGG